MKPNNQGMGFCVMKMKCTQENLFSFLTGEQPIIIISFPFPFSLINGTKRNETTQAKAVLRDGLHTCPPRPLAD